MLSILFDKRNDMLSIRISILKIRLYEAYGIHPRYLDTDPYNDLLELRNLIQTRPMIAVGECGLDLLNSEQLSLQTTYPLPGNHRANS